MTTDATQPKIELADLTRYCEADTHINGALVPASYAMRIKRPFPETLYACDKCMGNSHLFRGVLEDRDIPYKRMGNYRWERISSEEAAGASYVKPFILLGERFFRCEYGDLYRSVGTGRARCRICGEKIAKGEPEYTAAYDFTGSGSWTAVTVHAHRNDPTAKSHESDEAYSIRRTPPEWVRKSKVEA